MRALLGIVALTLLGIGVTRFAVQAGDEDTLVPPPASVAKALVTHLHARRPGPAHQLTAYGSCGLDESQLRRMSGEIRARWPQVQHVDADETGRVAGTATAEAVLQQRGGREDRLPVRLVREQGEWRVQCLTLP